jgi:hypothetical protein
VSAADWATVADLATALGTLILAIATFSAVRSANLSARVAQASLLAGQRPVLMAARRDDPVQKVNFGDSTWVRVPGGGAVGKIGQGYEGAAGEAVYLAMGLRNAGSGIAVLHGWRFYPGWHRDEQHAPLAEFVRQSRDLYIPSGDIGYWQGAFRDPDDPRYGPARAAIETHEAWTVELLYGDHEGGQRAVSRFTVLPHDGADVEPHSRWLATQSRHWNVDRPDPRHPE